MKINDIYTVSNTNGNRRCRDAVRVYAHGVKIAEVTPTSRNPLRYVRQHPGSKYRAKLLDQLLAAAVPSDIIASILS
jgi:hypothetical protein